MVDCEEIQTLLKLALLGDEKGREQFCDLCNSAEIDSSTREFCSENLPKLGIPANEYSAMSQAIVLHRYGFYEHALNVLKASADGGSWRAQQRLGFWLVRRPEYSFSGLNGLKYLKDSAGKGHWQGIFGFHSYSRIGAPLYKKCYHLIAMIFWLPFVWREVGLLAKKERG